MPVESAKLRILNTGLDGETKEDLVILMANLVDGIQALAAKLDADATVTDTNYAAVFAGFVTD